MTATIRQRLAPRLDTITPRQNCLRCQEPTRAPDMICAACFARAARSAAGKAAPARKAARA